MDKITQALSKMFERFRIVFWYDAKKELRSDFESLSLKGVEKIELGNNEFQVKHRILREEPQAKFLLYHEGPRPSDIDNWLLDVLLAHEEFNTDRMTIWLNDLGLDLIFRDVVDEHSAFFQAAKRRDALKTMLKPDDTPGQIRTKMLAVCAGCDPRIDAIMESLLAEHAQGNDQAFKLISRCNLHGFLWTQLDRIYGYRSESPGVRDFAITLFKHCYGSELDAKPLLNSDAVVFLKRWKDSVHHRDAFVALSNESAGILGIQQDLLARNYRSLEQVDFFRLVEQKIISDLVKDVAQRTITDMECMSILRSRRKSPWHDEFKYLYEAVGYASSFLQAFTESDLRMESLADGIKRYTASWYRLDQLYRKFVHSARRSGQVSLLQQLAEQVENTYVNSYVLKINDAAQAHIDKALTWGAPPLSLQKNFFRSYVEKYSQNRKKVFVVISDALRYEIAEEFLRVIRKEDRYEASLDSLLAMLPSYTQLGMAALLPHQELRYKEDEAGTILVDGESSQGTANRSKILEKALGQRAKALRAEDLLAMNKEESRELVRSHDVVYVYHNRIDATGDKRDTEEKVFEAVQETLDELLTLIKKLAAANATNMIVTADHGFLYQHRPIDASDFTDIEPKGERIFSQDRRFVVGRGLAPQDSLRLFRASEIGLAGDIEVQLPKSVNRLRLKGAGSRYVHGGASLQEIVVPVLHINKKRQSDIAQVEVDILRSAGTTITSGQLSVVFYQVQPVTDKVRPRKLRAGIYSADGKLISDSHDLAFDFTTENARERELAKRFILTKEAEAYNGQDVILKLDEKLEGTSHYRPYKLARYTLRRSFTSDFDF
ncbi:MAG TPA: BREX-1 system phosphatase PglZ type A [Deltaproteobacteria bacterium]|nr:BREX-1 system phosphatase PglZ type A [Deltaproteobacteria bacterium]